jgi:hypothetical protein
MTFAPVERGRRRFVGYDDSTQLNMKKPDESVIHSAC